LTTAAVLQRYLPNLSEDDIQDKIAKGEIAKPRLLRKRSVEKCNQKPKKENKNDNETNQGTSNNNNSLVGTSSMFFINVHIHFFSQQKMPVRLSALREKEECQDQISLFSL
jgi:hypothetical protein